MAETVLNQQESKLNTVGDTQRQNNHLKRIVGIILSLVMIVLTAFVLHLQHQNNFILSQSSDIALSASDHATVNYRTYVGKYKQTKIELDETTAKLEEVNRQLNQVTAELATTKGMLSETQGMLAQAQEENSKLKEELQGISGQVPNAENTQNTQNVGELQDNIKALKERDSKITSQLTDLKTQLRAFEADFSSTTEGRSLIVLFQNKIRLVKSRMHYLKQEAFFARVAAQKEKDRLAVLNGNSGFVLKDGKLQNTESTNKSFAIDVKVLQ